MRRWSPRLSPPPRSVHRSLRPEPFTPLVRRHRWATYRAGERAKGYQEKGCRLSGISEGGWSSARSMRPGVVQVEPERDPPEAGVGEHDDARPERPLTREQEVGEAQRSQYLAGHPDRGHRPVLFGEASDLQVEDAVQADHHAQAGKHLRVVRQWHPSKA